MAGQQRNHLFPLRRPTIEDGVGIQQWTSWEDYDGNVWVRKVKDRNGEGIWYMYAFSSKFILICGCRYPRA